MNNKNNQLILEKRPYKNNEKNYIKRESKIIQLIKQKKNFPINIFVYLFIIFNFLVIITHEYKLNSRKLISNSEIIMTFTEVGAALIISKGFYYLPDNEQFVGKLL